MPELNEFRCFSCIKIIYIKPFAKTFNNFKKSTYFVNYLIHKKEIYAVKVFYPLKFKKGVAIYFVERCSVSTNHSFVASKFQIGTISVV